MELSHLITELWDQQQMHTIFMLSVKSMLKRNLILNLSEKFKKIFTLIYSCIFVAQPYKSERENEGGVCGMM